MIFRAVFWIGFVALLMPREPDLGLGRPGAGTMPSLSALSAGMSGAGSSCERHARTCADGLSLLDKFQDTALRGLAQVKADIEASRKADRVPG
jgi:hypothetical protein